MEELVSDCNEMSAPLAVGARVYVVGRPELGDGTVR